MKYKYIQLNLTSMIYHDNFTKSLGMTQKFRKKSKNNIKSGAK